MFKKMGIGVLIVFGVLGIFYVFSYRFSRNIENMMVYNDITKNYIIYCLRFVLFGVVLGVPVIARLFKKAGKWTVDFYYVLLPIVLLFLLILPIINERYLAQEYFFIDGFAYYSISIICIAFGYSLTLLANKDEMQTTEE